MAASIAGSFNLQEFTDAGALAVSGRIYTYTQGTTTHKDAFTDKAGTIAHTYTNDGLGGKYIALNSRGELPAPLYLTAGAYDITYKTSAGATVWTRRADPIDDMRTDLAASSGSSLVGFLQAGTGAVARTMQSKERDIVSALDFGVVGNGTTDDLAALNVARDAAAAAGLALYLPPASVYYKLSAKFSITTNSFRLYGAGVKSCLVIHNASGDSALEINGAQHVRVSNIGLSGILLSGHGLHITGASHYGEYENIWIGWVAGDGVRITSGQSGTFNAVKVDQNNGYRPITLTSGSEGNTVNGFHILSDASGNTNNNSFVNCQSNAGSITGYGLKVGTSGGTRVQSFSWTGGLIQGSVLHQEVYLHTQDAVIDGAHIEPPAGVDATHYVVTMEVCNNTVIKNCTLVGDAQMIGACDKSGFENVGGTGFSISSTSTNSFLRDVQYGNVVTGPLGGAIIDSSKVCEMVNITNAANTAFTLGDNLRGRGDTYFQTRMDDWYGGASPTNPCLLDLTGAGTISREATIVNSGTYSAKIITVSQGDGIQQFIDLINATPSSNINGRWVVVEAWVYSVGAGNRALISCTTSPAGSTVSASGATNDAWERLLCSFYVTSAATAIKLVYTTQAGQTVYFDRIKVTIEDYSPQLATTLGDTATPNVSSGGTVHKLLTTTGTTTVTNLLRAQVGEMFTINVQHAKTFTHDITKLILTGGVNFVGKANDSISFVLRADGILHEVSRSVL